MSLNDISLNIIDPIDHGYVGLGGGGALWLLGLEVGCSDVGFMARVVKVREGVLSADYHA